MNKFEHIRVRGKEAGARGNPPLLVKGAETVNGGLLRRNLNGTGIGTGTGKNGSLYIMLNLHTEFMWELKRYLELREWVGNPFCTLPPCEQPND